MTTRYERAAGLAALTLLLSACAAGALPPKPTDLQPIKPPQNMLGTTDDLGLVADVIRTENQPYMKHLDLSEQGYTLVDVTPEACTVEFRGIDTFDPDAVPYTFARFRVARGSRTLEVLPPG